MCIMHVDSWPGLAKTKVAVTCFVFALFSFTASSHATDIYLRNLTPDVIPVTWVVMNVDTNPGAPSGRGHVTVLKHVDKSTPVLFQRLCDGQQTPFVQIDIRSADVDLVRYFRIGLHDVFVTGLEDSVGHGQPQPVETLSLSYGRVEWTYIQTDVAGDGEYAGSTYWDDDVESGGHIDLDSDGDGIPDSYEVSHKLKLLVDDAAEDFDGDGLSNREEYLVGTSASDPDSVLKVSGVSTPTTDGFNVQLVFDSIPGRTYQLYAMSVVGGPRTLVHTVTASSDSTTIDLDLPGIFGFVVVVVPVD